MTYPWYKPGNNNVFTNFTPQVLSAMRTNVSRWGIPAVTLLLAWDLWNDIIAD